MHVDKFVIKLSDSVGAVDEVNVSVYALIDTNMNSVTFGGKYFNFM